MVRRWAANDMYGHKGVQCMCSVQCRVPVVWGVAVLGRGVGVVDADVDSVGRGVT